MNASELTSQYQKQRTDHDEADTTTRRHGPGGHSFAQIDDILDRLSTLTKRRAETA